MAIRIETVEKGSPAAGHARAGEALAEIDGHAVGDVLDYLYYSARPSLTLTLESPEGKRRHVRIRKDEYEELGLNFSSYLMDEQRCCRNHCVFCFIDQLPRGLRQTLYFKDDDARMSFLRGSYITLTNLSAHDIDRIEKMKISPVNISVHTMNPELRARMMRNPRAAELPDVMRRFAAAGIEMNCQIVLCPGWNDGEELKRSLRELSGLWPSVRSVAVVPVGLTKYRERLETLVPVDAVCARETVRIIEERGSENERRYGDRIVRPADEFFLQAGLPLPPYAYFGEFDQLENGVGMLTMFRHEFESALADAKPTGARRRLTSVTGAASFDAIRGLADSFHQRFPETELDVVKVTNSFFGERITVTGLLTGQDILAALRGRDLGEKLLLPAATLRFERDRFLDDMTLDELSDALHIPIRVVECDGGDFCDALRGE